MFKYRMTLAFFCLSGLDLLGALESEIPEERRKIWIDWIYAQQILPDEKNPSIYFFKLKINQ